VKLTLSQNVFDISKYLKGAGVYPLVSQKSVSLTSVHRNHRVVIISNGRTAEK
jgi:hypothetical protein